jgi:hypothetical protein
MSKILTQVKTTTTCWAVPNLITSVEELEVKSLFDLSINEVSFRGTVLSAVCTSVEDTRTYTLSDADDPVPFFEPADDEVFKCVKSLIDMTSPTLQTFKELEELQHWIENKKRDISLKN